MQFTSSVRVTAESIVQPEASDVDVTSSSKQVTQVSCNAGLTTIVAVVLCIGCIFGLFITDFSFDPGSDSHIDCETASMASETVQTISLFFLGWFCCFMLKHRRKLPEYGNEALQTMIKFQSSVNSVVASAASAFSWARPRNWRLEERMWLSKGALSIILVGILCILTVTGLLVSAFAAVPDKEPAHDGLASEVSTVVRYFTATWIFCLSLKLLHELVGLVGWSCYFQPW